MLIAEHVVGFCQQVDAYVEGYNHEEDRVASCVAWGIILLVDIRCDNTAARNQLDTGTLSRRIADSKKERIVDLRFNTHVIHRCSYCSAAYRVGISRRPTDLNRMCFNYVVS